MCNIFMLEPECLMRKRAMVYRMHHVSVVKVTYQTDVAACNTISSTCLSVIQ